MRAVLPNPDDTSLAEHFINCIVKLPKWGSGLHSIVYIISPPNQGSAILLLTSPLVIGSHFVSHPLLLFGQLVCFLIRWGGKSPPPFYGRDMMRQLTRQNERVQAGLVDDGCHSSVDGERLGVINSATPVGEYVEVE